MTLRLLTVTFVVTICLTACDRGLVYGERTGLNLAVRSDPANSSPLEVNVGLQRRVVSSIPPERRENGVASGDAVNMVSRFDLERTPGSGPFDAKVKIGTSFASGGAARAIAGDVNVVKGIAEVPTISLSDDPDVRTTLTKLFNFTGQSVENAQTYLNLARARGLDIGAGDDPNSQAVATIGAQENAVGNKAISDFLKL